MASQTAARFRRQPSQLVKVWRYVPPILLGLLIAPFLFESAALLYAHWRTMSGEELIIATPCLDFIGEIIRSCFYSSKISIGGLFRDPAWRPGWVIGLALVSAIGGGYMLLKHR